MRSYFVKIGTLYNGNPVIIEDETLHQIECGMLHGRGKEDDYDYLCEGECMNDAIEYANEMFSRYWNDIIGERHHP